MTSPSLTIGSIFLAYSPTLSLLFVLVFRKPQLVILAVCSAFAYLVAALLSSLFWLATSAIGGAVNSGENNYGSSIAALMALAIPGVACQMLIRCLFVRGYFKVENVIRRSVAKHEEETAAAAAATGNNNTSNGGAATTNGEGNGTVDTDAHAETNALQLQLNDLSCSLASGCGYALLHSLFLYGTLLASESGESGSYNDGGAYAGGGGSTGHGGTLYQESCGGMPSLVNGALIACLFSVLDVMWMMLSFYGMRRRSMPNNATNAFEGSGGTVQNLWTGLACWGISDSPAGGNAAILLVSITHLAASLVLAPNAREDGCKISLPLLGGVVIWVALVLRKVAKKGFLPEDQRRRIQGMQLGLRNIGESHHVE